MAIKTVQDSSLTAVADAIREKGGTEALLEFPNGFISAIEDIKGGTGGITWDGIAQNIQPAGNIILDGNSIRTYALYNKPITSIKAKNVEVIEGYALAGTQITVLVLPKFYMQNAWQAFYRMYKCEKIDIKGRNFMQHTFEYSELLTTLILRNNSLVALGHTNCFNRTPFANDGTGGTLYVPSALISEYQSATNWSTILGYANNQILPIEGSQYETHYADGTVIS